jgi:hypothetical protein
MKKIYIVICALLAMYSCSNDDASEQENTITNITLTLTTVDNITASTARISAEAFSTEGTTVEERGFCWSTSPNPDITDSNLATGTTLGEFSDIIEPLEPETTYYVRAYVLNKGTTQYSSEQNFTTTPNIFEGDITLGNQEQVDSFGASGYTQVTGTLTIADFVQVGEPITNLTPLATIEKVNGLYIQRIDATTLSGLENITEVRGRIFIGDNFNLLNIDALQNITTPVREITISGNKKLTNLDALSSIPKLINFEGFDPRLKIFDNEALTNISGIAGITSDENLSLTISQNPLLVSIAPLFNITNSIQSLSISGNSSLNSLEGLSQITSIDFAMDITANKLQNYDHLSSLQSVGGNVRLGFDDSVENIDGLQNLTNVGGDFIFRNLQRIIDVDGLSSLTFIGGEKLEIIANVNLTDLEGLQNVSAPNLTTLEVQTNTDLTDLCGIQQIAGDPGFTAEYIVFSNSYNPTLQQMQKGNCSL